MMMARQEVAFVFNLLQDVNIARGLAYLVRRETDADVHLLVTRGFLKRDTREIWQKELADIAADLGADIHVIAADGDAQAALQGRGGVLVTSSESDLGPHRETAAILQSAPSSFVTVTLQHGLECVGFRQSREHVISHGRDVGFNADVICTWFDLPRLTATRVSERGKVVVTGPSTLIQRPRAHPDHPPLAGGMVCENMHSVRLAATGNHKASFMDIFFDFCARMDQDGKQVTLRPHPGGQYVLKNNVALPDNVMLNNLPVYDVNMGGYQYGISAPSTVVLDMVLAGLPVGVWSDTGGIMDLGNYKGLTEISGVEDWIAFERESRLAPAYILDRQARYLEGLGVPTDAAEVYRRYTRLFQNILGRPAPGMARPQPAAVPQEAPSPSATTARASVSSAPPKRVLYIVNRMLATLQLSFLKPLAGHVERGEITEFFLTEDDINERFGAQSIEEVAGDWVAQQIAEINPDLILCCRYSGPQAARILQVGKALNVPVVYHIDDDLLNIPKALGESKWRMHNDPKKLQSVRTLLDGADLVYASTRALHAQLQALGAQAPILHGDIYCSAHILREAAPGPVRKVGYMGTSGHAHDFEPLVPVIAAYLDRNPDVSFELFGLSPVPGALQRFGDRVRIVPPVASYEAFLAALADRQWDIGLCPLANIPFNAVKANTKWVEYTSCGMATIATKGLVYDGCAGDGRGILVDPQEWGHALQVLTDDPDLRHAMARQAQDHLRENYSEKRLRDQVLSVFETARNSVQARPGRSTAAGRAGATRLLFVANDTSPALQRAFLKPLAALTAQGDIVSEVVTETELAEVYGAKVGSPKAARWLSTRVLEFKPDMIVCCGYTGPHAASLVSAAEQLDIPLVYHVEDHPLGAPDAPGAVADHAPGRQASASTLLRHATLVYCATATLKRQLRRQGITTPMLHGDIHSAGRVMRVTEPGPVRRVGYVGYSDHGEDLQIALPGLQSYLERNPSVEFEILGALPMPDALLRFGGRVRALPHVRKDAKRRKVLADRQWDIGIAPLAHTPFNAVKADTKWVDYTACGMATIATKGLVHDSCAADGRGLLVTRTEWAAALEVLTEDPVLRHRMALQAQAHLLLSYSETALLAQVQQVFDMARTLHAGGRAGGDSAPRGRLAPTVPDAQGLIALPQ